MQFSKACEGYILASLSEGYSQLTLNAYRSALKHMQDYLGNKEVEDITTDDLRGFMKYLVTDYTPERRNNPANKEPLSTASHHRYWKAMRSFFKWAERDLDVGRPDQPIKMPKWENQEIVPFTEEELKALVKGSEHSEISSAGRRTYKYKHPNGMRDKAIILTLLDTGVRVGELTRLRVKDVNLENGEVFIHPFHVKKTHSRTTYLGKAARKALWRYLVSRDDLRDDAPLFVTIEDHPLSRERVLNILSRLGKNLGIAKVHPHRFRHTMAIQYLRNGGDIFTLQRILGHRRLDMVNRYLNIVSSDVASAHKRASPADNWHL